MFQQEADGITSVVWYVDWLFLLFILVLLALRITILIFVPKQQIVGLDRVLNAGLYVIILSYIVLEIF